MYVSVFFSHEMWSGAYGAPSSHAASDSDGFNRKLPDMDFQHEFAWHNGTHRPMRNIVRSPMI